MSSDKKGVVKLSDGWVLCTSKSNPGRKYYFNKRTGKSSWTQPQATEKSDRKHKNKKEKVNREKNKKEEAQKNLKRKSDGNESQELEKKKLKKEVTATPTKQKVNSPSPLKPSPSTKETPQKRVKNAANQRLSQLRARLSLEAQDESTNSTDQSPSKAVKSSPTTATTPKPATETKPPKVENKSPNVTENKCTTSQSPSSDSLQSIPSPSQFFAANKIICSMKAQLPEDAYCDNPKPKDTFADIEQGICNQTSEYPYMKHPSTPPQFSQASKLLSAIKSKLTKVAVSKDGSCQETVETYASASERMEKLRASLSSDLMEIESDPLVLSSSVSIEKNCSSEGMDVDLKEIKQVAAPLANCTKDNISTDLVLVVDTNIFIHELSIIKNVLNSNIKGFSGQPTLLVPWRVVNELDRLKDNNNCNGAVWKRAKRAMDYLYKSIPENSRIRGQPLRDANSHIYPCESPDDEILNCALQQAERGKTVILLSNDKILCSKAEINNVRSLSLSELNDLLETAPQETDPDAFDNLKHYQATIYQLLANILENEMRAKYNNLWQHVLFKAPPWTLADVLQCLLKHWIAVFNEVFPRIEHLIIDLKNSLTSVDSKEMAKKCQIIPEYMELAKVTVDRLLNDRACDAEDEKHGELMVIEAFENVWTVMSSFCAKLASRLGVSHNIEDKWPGDEPLEALTTKLTLFTNQITAFALAIKGVLSSENPESSIEALEQAFRDSLQLICMDNEYINKTRLATFCGKCRNMLQEAYTKFAQLTELIEVCKNTLNTANQ
ncbi:hypothetical protein HW555_004773 [Spodoptera exigua]|uniref:WW domain-containing protein n=1 Tax=Spodoptera exigua TaxID=7107 RepID=A0A835L759_SPOEX|nr:hypothetical protein HW555_004773 [Spodoptera exigua]